MFIPRIYQNTPLEIGKTLELDNQSSHYLARVMRVKMNDAVALFNGQGGEYHAIVSKINKKNIVLAIEKFLDKTAESPLHLHLLQGISRSDPMDFSVQKAVELGVSEITPVLTQASPRLSKQHLLKREQHWQKIIISACEQCGRNTLPKLNSPINLKDLLTEQTVSGIYFDPRATISLKQLKITENSVSYLVGAESGLHRDEIARLKEYAWQGVQLGPRVLRTETATVTTTSLLQAQFGDLII